VYPDCETDYQIGGKTEIQSDLKDLKNWDKHA
jgi:hypothetical protein